MARVRHLARAPIKEAVIDFRVTSAPDGAVSDFRSLVDEHASEFASVSPIWMTGFQIQVGPQAADDVKKENVEIGVRLGAPGQVVQLRRDGFTFSKLEPYTSWEDIAPVALEWWDRYCLAARPLSIDRVAMRYVNHIPLPAPPFDLDEFLTCAPRVPAELPQFFAQFGSRVVVDAGARGFVSVVQMFNSPELPPNAVVLDIDAFRLGSFGRDRADVLPVFEDLRELRNQAFFGSLTERCLESME